MTTFSFKVAAIRGTTGPDLPPIHGSFDYPGSTPPAVLHTPHGETLVRQNGAPSTEVTYQRATVLHLHGKQVEYGEY